MWIAVFVLGLGFSVYALVAQLRAARAAVPHVKPLPPEIHFVAAMIAGAGAGLAWGSLWGLLAFVAQALGGVLAATKLRG